jgi:hypothetical protein
VTASPDVLVAALSPAARRLLTTALTHCYELVVRGIACRCPECGLEGLAAAVIHPDLGLPDVYDVVDAGGGIELGFAKELLQEARNPVTATIKHRRRDDDGELYLSGGCARCDAMFDPYELADAVAGAQERGEIGSLPVLAKASRTIAEWAMLYELAKTSAFDED